MMSMTELPGGELCLPLQPQNEVGAARRRSSMSYMLHTTNMLRGNQKLTSTET